MVEVFKTNVVDPRHAEIILKNIHSSFNACSANFDLEDCDKILRVESKTVFIHNEEVIRVVREAGYSAEILPDTIPGFSGK